MCPVEQKVSAPQAPACQRQEAQSEDQGPYGKALSELPQGRRGFAETGFSFQIEMKYRAYKNKANALEFPIIFEDRKFGQSKMSKSIFLEALLNVLKIRFMV